MPSIAPQDFGKVVMPRTLAAAVERASIPLGQWTANTTVTKIGMAFDRAAVIREIWFASDAVGADSDGTMLINAIVNDLTEGPAADTIVASFDAEAVILVANKAYKATLAAETTENQNTVESGDVLYFTLVNNSAAINTNANLVATVVFQTLDPVT